jgi:hypothetical protein
MLFREILAVYCENLMEHTDTLFEHNTKPEDSNSGQTVPTAVTFTVTTVLAILRINILFLSLSTQTLEPCCGIIKYFCCTFCWPQLQDEVGRQAREHEATTQQIEDDADREIVELKTGYEKLLHEERETNLRLRGEAGVMKKKFTR